MTVLDSDHHLCDAVDEPPREPWYATATVVIALTIAALIAVGIAVSAVLVVSREPVDPTGAVVPTIPITPTPPPMAPTMAPTSAPVPTQAPTRAPTIVPSALPPSPCNPVPANPLQSRRQAAQRRPRAHPRRRNRPARQRIDHSPRKPPTFSGRLALITNQAASRR